jgi:death-on-curing family protein
LSQIRYLSVEQLIEINKIILKEVKVKKADSHKVLSSATLREILEETKTEGSNIYEKAAILLIELTQRHPFASGVRRTAYAAAKLFLEANGERVHVKYEPKVMQGIRERFYRREEVVSWLKGHEIREFARF